MPLATFPTSKVTSLLPDALFEVKPITAVPELETVDGLEPDTVTLSSKTIPSVLPPVECPSDIFIVAPLKVVAPNIFTWPVAFVKVPLITIVGLDDAEWLPNISWLSKIIVPLTVTVPAVIPTIALPEVPCISKVALLPTVIFPLPRFISSSTWTLPEPVIVRSLFSEPCLVITVSESPSYNLKVSLLAATPILASSFNWIVELLNVSLSDPPSDK